MPQGPARLEIAPYSTADAFALERELGIGHLLAQVLVRRGYGDPVAAKVFLAGDELLDATQLGGAAEAAAQIREHITRGSKIVVHGDYDADGVCGTSLLVTALRRAGAEVEWFVPDRERDGYGLAAATIERLAAGHFRPDLIVTVDCAITATAEVELAKQHGIEVIITDHHQPAADGSLPDCTIVHPQTGGYPFDGLCGTAVAFKLMQVLGQQLDKDLTSDALDLVAIATVADVMPLTGENRRLVREGLNALRTTTRPGLQALLQSAELSPAELDAQAIAFKLAPRLNAPGRVRSATTSVELLLTPDEERARAVAKEIERLNSERRALQQRTIFAAQTQITELGERSAYVLADEKWQAGVVGLVASRVAEQQGTPAVVIAWDGETGSGSCRSIPGFELPPALGECAHLLERFGGHAQAAGLTIKRENFEQFRTEFEQVVARQREGAQEVFATQIDAVATGETFDLDLAHELSRLEPCGQSNPRPNLLLAGATMRDVRPLGKEGKHISFALESGGIRPRVLQFGSAKPPVAESERGDFAVRLEVGRWRDRIEPKLFIEAGLPPRASGIVRTGQPADFLASCFEEVLRGAPAPSAPAEPLSELASELRVVPSVVGCLSDLVASGEPVLATCAHSGVRQQQLQALVGGFTLCDLADLEVSLEMCVPAHVVLIDPPTDEQQQQAVLSARDRGCTVHLAYGSAELQFAESVTESQLLLDDQVRSLWGLLREQTELQGEQLELELRGQGAGVRTPVHAARLLRALDELQLAEFEPDQQVLRWLPAPPNTDLAACPALQEYRNAFEEASAWLMNSPKLAA